MLRHKESGKYRHIERHEEHCKLTRHNYPPRSKCTIKRLKHLTKAIKHKRNKVFNR